MFTNGYNDPGNIHLNAAFQETELKFQNITKALEEKDLGNKAYKGKDFAAAHKHYEKAIELDPNNIVFYTNKSAVLFEEERFDECLELCELALSVGRDNRANATLIAKPLARIGRVHLKKNNYVKAVEQLELSLAENRVDSVVKEVEKVKKTIEIEKDFGTVASVEVRDSPVHGRGVFTLRKMKRGERVCFYDGELKTQSQLHKQVREQKVALNKEYWMSHPSNPDLTLCGYSIPQNKFGCGQLINDSKMPKIEELDYRKGLEECEEYVTESQRLANTSFMPEGKEFYIYAIKDIDQGEELFLHYGYKMWLQDMSESLPQEDYMKKLLYWTLDGETTGLSARGEVKMFKAEDIENYSELDCQGFMEMYLRMPPELIEKCKNEIEDFSFTSFLADLVGHINYDKAVNKSSILM